MIPVWSPGRTDGAMEPEQLFVNELESIESVIDSICRRYGLYGARAEDFASWVRLKIMEDDYRVLRKFEGRSSLTTYLFVVVANLYRDHRIKKTGKWRPSAKSRRLGPVAVKLDALMNRDGLGMTEAVRMIMEQGDDPGLSERELREMAARIPDRPRRSFTSDEALATVAGSEGADEEFRAHQRTDLLQEAHGVLEDALEALPEEDQVIIRMRYLEGLTVASIARTLGLEQKPLYRRIDRTLDELRESMEERGVDEEHVAELLVEAG